MAFFVHATQGRIVCISFFKLFSYEVMRKAWAFRSAVEPIASSPNFPVNAVAAYGNLQASVPMDQACRRLRGPLLGLRVWRRAPRKPLCSLLTVQTTMQMMAQHYIACPVSYQGAQASASDEKQARDLWLVQLRQKCANLGCSTADDRKARNVLSSTEKCFFRLDATVCPPIRVMPDSTLSMPVCTTHQTAKMHNQSRGNM